MTADASVKIIGQVGRREAAQLLVVVAGEKGVFPLGNLARAFHDLPGLFVGAGPLGRGHFSGRGEVRNPASPAQSRIRRRARTGARGLASKSCRPT